MILSLFVVEGVFSAVMIAALMLASPEDSSVLKSAARFCARSYVVNPVRVVPVVLPM